MTGGYAIVPYERTLKAGVLDLQRHLWSDDLDLNRAYFEWKYDRNPSLPGPLAAVVLHEGAVVGMRGLAGSTWEAGDAGEAVVLPYVDDLVLAPEHRVPGLAARILAATHEIGAGLGAPFLVNLSAGELTAMQSYASGWRSAGAMLPVARGDRPRGARRLVRDRGARSGPFASLERVRGPVVVERAPRPGAMARLVASLPYDGRIRQRRDEAFLAWRFANPLHEYRFLFLGDDPPEGYLVLQRKVADPPGGRVRIVDWEARDVGALEALLSAAVAGAGPGELTAWEAAQPAGGPALLHRAGFRPVDLERRSRGMPAILVRSTRPDDDAWTLAGRPVLDPASWDVRLLYSMHG